MVMLQNPSINTNCSGTVSLFEELKVNSTTLEHYLHGLQYPASKQQIITHAKRNRTPQNIMAFYAFRLPERPYLHPSDISFTVFMSSFMFGQD